MNFQIIVPVHNEENHLQQMIDSLVSQTMQPKRIIFVDDHSTDNSLNILRENDQKYPFIQVVPIQSYQENIPGAKVVQAFYKGIDLIEENYDILCKFDADLIFPSNYLEEIARMFSNNPKCGMAGGFCTIEKNGKWVVENLTNQDHIRGALKAYRKECFEQIGGLKKSMGWDTADELLAQYHGWEIQTNPKLLVQHLKATGSTYSKKARFKQGEAFKKLRYGFWLTLIASGKLAWQKKSFSFFIDCLVGFFKTKGGFLVSKTEGKFIRKLRWRNIKKKLF